MSGGVWFGSIYFDYAFGPASTDRRSHSDLVLAVARVSTSKPESRPQLDRGCYTKYQQWGHVAICGTHTYIMH